MSQFSFEQKIEILSKMALDYCNENGLKFKQYNQKFAELIVEECFKFCDEVIKEAEIAMEQCEMVKTSDRLMMLHNGTRNGAQMSKNRIKRHFGVKL